MSDSKKPKPLPDDFSETTPNIKMPKADRQGGSNDWEKTNYNYSPKDLHYQEDWNKTSYNTPKPPTPPGSKPKDGDWGMTEANINLRGSQSNPHEESLDDDFGPRQQHHGKTTPFIYLPESEKVKFQEPKPTKSKVEEQKEEAANKSSIPSWLWTVGGLTCMFLFAVTVMALVYLLFINRTGFEVRLKSVKPGTDVLVDNSYWGVSSADGIRLPVLKAGKRTLTFINPSFKCNPIEVTGADGDALIEKSVECSPASVAVGGFEVVIVNAPPKSEVWVDNKNAGMTDDKGSAKIEAVEVGPRKIEIKNPNFKCSVQDVSGAKGDKKELTAKCRPPEIPNECFEFKKGEYAKQATCAYTELARLEKLDLAGTPYTVEQVLFAMNLYIVNFDSGKFVIKPLDMKFVERASMFIKKLPGSTVVEIGGHTDNVGKDVKNVPLSENRAKAVRDAMVKFSIKSETFQIKGYGPRQPIEDNATEDGRFRNRRIQYTVVSK